MVYLAAQYLLYQKEEFVENISFQLTDSSVMPADDGSSFSSFYSAFTFGIFVHNLDFLFKWREVFSILFEFHTQRIINDKMLKMLCKGDPQGAWQVNSKLTHRMMRMVIGKVT